MEVTTSYLQGEDGVEIRIESVIKDNSHSSVRISHGLNKLVTELSNNEEKDNNEQETSEMQFDNFSIQSNARALQADQRLKQNHRDVLLPVHPQELYTWERKWTDVEPEDHSPVNDPVSQQLSTLLRHGHLLRGDDGVIELGENKGISSERSCAISTLV